MQVIRWNINETKIKRAFIIFKTEHGLCCFMTPCVSKDIQCDVWPYFSKLANDQIRPHIKWAVSLVIACGHFGLSMKLVLFHFLCIYFGGVSFFLFFYFYFLFLYILNLDTYDVRQSTTEKYLLSSWDKPAWPWSVVLWNITRCPLNSRESGLNK